WRRILSWGQLFGDPAVKSDARENLTKSAAENGLDDRLIVVGQPAAVRIVRSQDEARKSSGPFITKRVEVRFPRTARHRHPKIFEMIATKGAIHPILPAPGDIGSAMRARYHFEVRPWIDESDHLMNHGFNAFRPRQKGAQCRDSSLLRVPLRHERWL